VTRPRRPLPVPDPDTQPFWDGTKNRQLLVQRCRANGHVQFYPRSVCVTCAEDVEWFEASGLGVVYSFTVVRQSGAAPFKEMTPYVLALVELDEGENVRMMTNIVGCQPDAVSIGMRVAVSFEPETEDITLPLWRPADPR
jgi:uncharacterized OB-fold protein